MDEARFGFMIENAVDIISLLNERNEVIYINPAVEKITGYTVAEFKATPGMSVVHPEDRGDYVGIYATLLANPGKPVQRNARLLHKNGSVIWVEGILVNLLHEPHVRAIVSNYRDVTSRKEAEAAVMAGEKRFRNTLDQMMEGVQIIDFSWRYVYVNEAVTKHGCYTEQDLIGHTMMEKYPGIEKSEMFQSLQKCMVQRIPIFMENQFDYPDGTTGWFELSIQPVPEGIFILSIDISGRKANEAALQQFHNELEQKVEERTEQLSRANHELEAFSYSVSHDLRAPLRAINGYARIIEEDYETTLDAEGKRLLNVLQYNARKMGNLIDDLLDFSRLGRKEVQRSRINMQELTENVLNDIGKSQHYNAQISIGPLQPLEADYSLMSQVMLNLISNAIKYSSQKEQPQISITSELQPHEIIFCVRDNGAGFDMQYADKLFGVFQRLHTSDEFEGTGVGLAIVQRIVSKHGGRVWAEGKPNKGAAFYFSIPAS